VLKTIEHGIWLNVEVFYLVTLEAVLRRGRAEEHEGLNERLPFGATLMLKSSWQQNGQKAKDSNNDTGNTGKGRGEVRRSSNIDDGWVMVVGGREREPPATR
jgi:hypothetical protein